MVTPSGVNRGSACPDSANECQPAGAASSKPRLTSIRVQSPGMPANRSVSARSVTTCRTSPRATRSARSSGPSRVLAGMITTPSFIAARMTSHNGAMLPSMSSSRSPRRAPRPRSQLAT